MADRSISVRLNGIVGGYLTSMQAAAAATREYGSSVAAAAAKNEAASKEFSKTSAIAGGVLLGSLVLAAGAAAKFDAQMSVVKANIDDKTAPSMKRLSDAALDAGKTTAFSALDAAKAEEELAKAGLTSAQITGGALKAALDLASAGQIDLGDAAEITASTMVQFGLKASDASRIADDLAAGADKSLGGVQDLAEALKYAGVPASQFGISLESTVGVLAEFASNGIEGSMAGTSLRQMLLSLASPTKEASATLHEYGINVFDAQGKFIGLAGLAQQLHDKLGGLTQQQQQAALSTIFTARSVSTANILMRDGAKGVDEWTKAVNDQGFAAQQASTKLDNLSGDARKLKNSLQVDLIKAGQDVTPVLRGLAQEATKLAQGFGDIPGPARQAVEVLIAITGSTLALAGIAGTAAPKIKALKEAMSAVAPAGTLAGSAVSALSKGLAIALPLTAAASLVYQQFASDAKQNKDALNDLGKAVQADGGAYEENTRKAVANKLAQEGVLDLAKKAGIALPTVTDAVLGNSKAMKTLEDAQKKSGVAGSAAIGVYNEATYWHKQVTEAAKKDAKATKEAGEAEEAAGTKTQKAAAAQAKLKQAAEDLAKAHASDPAYELSAALASLAPNAAKGTDKIKAMNTALTDFQEIALGVTDASAAAGDALATMAKAGAKGASVQQILNGDLLNSNAATRALEQNLSTVAGAYTKHLNEVYKSTAATKGDNAAIIAVNKTHGEQVKALQRTLDKMGITGKAADSLIKKYAGIPSDISTDVNLAKVAQAKADADSVKKSINNIPKQHTTVTQAQIGEMQRKLNEAKASIRGVPGSKSVQLRAEITEAQRHLDIIKQSIANLHSKDITIRERTIKTTELQTLRVSNGRSTAHAGGGPIRGAGSYTSDSIMTPTSNDEFVVRAASAHSVGINALNYINQFGRLPQMTPGTGPTSSSSSSAAGASSPTIEIGTFNQYASTTAKDVAEQFWYLTKARG